MSSAARDAAASGENAGSTAASGPASGPDKTNTPRPGPEPEVAPALPPLTPDEFREYNRLAEQMDIFVCPAFELILLGVLFANSAPPAQPLPADM